MGGNSDRFLFQFSILLFERLVNVNPLLLIHETNETKQNVESNFFEKVDVPQIPNSTIYINDSSLKLNNGVYFYGGVSPIQV